MSAIFSNLLACEPIILLATKCICYLEKADRNSPPLFVGVFWPPKWDDKATLNVVLA
jgi:hypothetical protein